MELVVSTMNLTSMILKMIVSLVLTVQVSFLSMQMVLVAVEKNATMALSRSLIKSKIAQIIQIIWCEVIVKEVILKS